MGVIPIHEAIVKDANQTSSVNISSNAVTLKTGQSASPPINTMMNFLTPTSSNTLHRERQTFSSSLMQSTRSSISELSQIGSSTTVLESGGSTIVLSTNSKPTPLSTFTSRTLSNNVIRRNCSYASISKRFPYYIPVPSSAKLNGKPKKYQSFVQAATEQEQSVLSPSGSEGSSRDSGFNSDSSSPTPPISSCDIEQLLDEIAALDDIN